MSDTQELQDKAYKVIQRGLDRLAEDGEHIGERDLTQLANVYVKLKQAQSEHTQDVWFKRLQELVHASDSIQNLVLGDPQDFKRVFGARVIFDKGKKKITLSA